MQILLALLVGALIGVGVHFSAAGRDTRGPVLAPMVGAVSAGLAWTILTWAGLGLDSPWLWLSALVVPPAVTYPAVILLTRLRRRHDADERVRLRIG
ncbi:hypothetical protein GCM10022200_08220 [Microbacterium awajiense]|uniref:Integral membrane protein n=1 Tax=Microbacterium awajiense TaxID=415214 RepID=A0ABP7AAZ4_9MICO